MSILKQSFFILSFLLLAACGQGFKSQTFESSENALCVSAMKCSGNDDSQNPEDPINKVDLDGTVSAGPFGSHKVIELDKTNHLLILNLPLPVNPLGAGFSDIPIQKIPGATISLEPITTGWALVLKVPLQYVMKGFDLVDPGKLPNGRSLPGIPGGQLPKLGLKLYNKGDEIIAYAGKGAIAVFVPTPQFDPKLGLTFPIKSKSQRKILGYFATIPEVGTSSGGFFLSIVLPKDVQKMLDKLFP